MGQSLSEAEAAVEIRRLRKQLDRLQLDFQINTARIDSRLQILEKTQITRTDAIETADLSSATDEELDLNLDFEDLTESQIIGDDIDAMDSGQKWKLYNLLIM